MNTLTARQYRVIYGIRSIKDCKCASEEYACGFLEDNEQLDLFEDYCDNRDIIELKEQFQTLEKTEVV